MQGLTDLLNAIQPVPICVGGILIILGLVGGALFKSAFTSGKPQSNGEPEIPTNLFDMVFSSWWGILLILIGFMAICFVPVIMLKGGG